MTYKYDQALAKQLKEMPYNGTTIPQNNNEAWLSTIAGMAKIVCFFNGSSTTL